MLATLLVACSLLHAGPFEKQGLYRISLSDGRAQYLGDYYSTSVDAEGGYLYADNGRGTVVRWRLDALSKPREVFVRSTPDWDRTLGFSCPVAAPKGGAVRIQEDFAVDDGGDQQYWRSCVHVYDRAGKHLRGPIPVTGGQDDVNLDNHVRWRPNGTQLALVIDEGERVEDSYVYDFLQNTWSLVALGHQMAPRWSPDGSFLATIRQAKWGEREEFTVLVVPVAADGTARAPREWARPRLFGVATGAFDWTSLGMCLPTEHQGLQFLDMDGNVVGSIADWWANDYYDYIRGPVSTGQFGFAWSAGVEMSPECGLYFVSKLGERAIQLANGNDFGDPEWDPTQRALYVAVGRPSN